ncbi:unnamed protein product [Adineta steineri]|uniref:Uncharacterized protein n=1 Tax=Adineta steineri TaxID=433720 RepID=A0A813XI89_9BILA|nr:unnamed protein product [Adineta steineri]CAF0876536.1 unnamed protein product [Adineta steineri]CAF3593029.1 unnamed protein product [Adineta steineri]CAF3961341.1 unnamed protein product [Adineta steineri]
MMKNLILLIGLVMIYIDYTNGISCYYCADCPIPFNAKLNSVTVNTLASTNWCAKKSSTADPNARNSRGPAEPGLCTASGCSWKTGPGGQAIWTCCCQGDFCNCG